MPLRHRLASATHSAHPPLSHDRGDVEPQPAPTDNLRDALIEYMLDRDVESAVSGLVLAAWDGSAALRAYLAGEAAPTPVERPSTQASPSFETRRSYLKRISVRGFRGIGDEAILELPAQNGLTLVLGRNGSGKSSFAEGAEMLLTGENARWKGKTADWKDGWRNLHAEEQPALAAEFVVEGVGSRVVAKRTWSTDSLAGSSLEIRGPAGASSLDELGWRVGLSTYRPFLPYSELAQWADKPSQLHDAVMSVLGLDRLDAVDNVLNSARKDLDKRKAGLQPEIDRVRAMLDGSADPRAAAALKGFLKTKVKPEILETALVGTEVVEADHGARELQAIARLDIPTTDEVTVCVAELRVATAAVESTRATAAENAHAVAVLLRAAVKAHDTAPDDGVCQVCGTPDVLSPRWRAEAAGRAESLEKDAHAYKQAQQRLERHVRTSKALTRRGQVPPEPVSGIEEATESLVATGRSWMAAGEHDDPERLASAIEAAFPDFEAAASLAIEAARSELSSREDEWSKIALELRRLIKEARVVDEIDEQTKALKSARNVVQATLAQHRDERFGPVAEQAKSVWSCLRSESNVSLVELALSGTGTRRKLDLSIAVDDVPGVAVGVMSQGELHALALSLFLPRAALNASPFGFMIIDDPVQSMDADRVDGLARALERASADRQVVVFTHDDRLFEAVRRLKISATVKRVERDPQSRVRVVDGKDPIDWYISDAMGLVLDRNVGSRTIQRVVPGLCRLALDAAIGAAFRRQRLEAGGTHQEVDETLDQNRKLVSRVSLVLFGEANRDTRAVTESIRNRFGRSEADAFHEANRGSHSGEISGDPRQFVRACERLARGLEDL